MLTALFIYDLRRNDLIFYERNGKHIVRLFRSQETTVKNLVSAKVGKF